MGTLSHHPAKADEFLNRADQTIDSHHPCILHCRRSASVGPQIRLWRIHRCKTQVRRMRRRVTDIIRAS